MAAPVINLSTLMACTVPVQIDGYRYEQRPILEKDIGRIGTQVRCEGYGFIMSDSAADFQAAIDALVNYPDGNDFTIKGQEDSILQQIIAASCIEGGPHVGFEILDEEAGPLYRRVKFVIEAKTIGDVIISAYTLKIAAAVDGLTRITQTGQLIGSSANEYFNSSVLPAFKASYSLPDFIVSWDVSYPFGAQGTEYDTVTKYTINAIELAGPLPDVSGAADGEMRLRSEVDNESHRETDVAEFDVNLTAESDYSTTVDSLRPIAIGIYPSPDYVLIRESSDITTVKQLRVRASFTFLSSSDSEFFLNYTRTVAVISADPTYEEFTYPGTTPIAVQRPTVFARISDSGTATGLGRFIQEPALLVPNLERPKTVRLVDVSDAEKQTSWNFELIDVDGTVASDLGTIAGQIGRPSEPSTY